MENKNINQEVISNDKKEWAKPELTILDKKVIENGLTDFSHESAAYSPGAS